MNEIGELRIALSEAAKYFELRGFSAWNSEALESIARIDSGDLKVIDNLCLKYAPTCEVEDLFITEYEQAKESEIVALNEALARIINATYLALERAQSANT